MTEFRVVRGDATPEELAAVVALLMARSGVATAPPPPTRSLWALPQLRSPLSHNPEAWRASGLPR